MESEKTTNQEGPELKRLGFVRFVAIQTLMCMLNMYNYTKQNSGPLKSAVGTVEGAVTTLLGPVYLKFKDLPDHLLVFLDEKVDELAQVFEKLAPSFAKKIVSRIWSLIHIVTRKVQELMHEAFVGGQRAAFRYAARESKDAVFTQSVRMLVKAHQLPVLHTVGNLAAPTVSRLMEKYNDVVKNKIEKGFPIFGHLPLVPIDEIGKAFKKEGGTIDKSDGGFPIFGRLPLVPNLDIGKAFKKESATSDKSD